VFYVGVSWREVNFMLALDYHYPFFIFEFRRKMPSPLRFALQADKELKEKINYIER
jgi:hypothetical protein